MSVISIAVGHVIGILFTVQINGKSDQSVAQIYISHCPNHSSFALNLSLTYRFPKIYIAQKNHRHTIVQMTASS